MTSPLNRLPFQQYELRAVRRRLGDLELPAEKENGRNMPTRGKQNSPVPNRGTPPRCARTNPDNAALIRNVCSHSVHTSTHWYTIKKFSAGPTPALPCSRFSRISRFHLSEKPRHSIIFIKTFGHSNILPFVTECYALLHLFFRFPSLSLSFLCHLDVLSFVLLP